MPDHLEGHQLDPIQVQAGKLRAAARSAGLAGDPMEALLEGMAAFLEALQRDGLRNPLSPQDAQLIAVAALRSVLRPLVDGVSRRVSRATIGVLVAALAGTMVVGICVGWYLRGPAGPSWAAMASGATCGPASSDGWRRCPAVIFTK